MAWNQQQKEAIFDSVWKAESVACPVDSAALTAEVHPYMNGNYVVFAHCPRCGETMQMGPADDPLGSKKRDWTDAEKAKMVSSAFAGATITCPVDSASIRAQVAPNGLKRIVRLHCFRCGNEYQVQ